MTEPTFGATSGNTGTRDPRLDTLPADSSTWTPEQRATHAQIMADSAAESRGEGRDARLGALPSDSSKWTRPQQLIHQQIMKDAAQQERGEPADASPVAWALINGELHLNTGHSGPVFLNGAKVA